MVVKQLDSAGFINTETGMKLLPCTCLEPFPDFVSQEKISRKENVFRTWRPDKLATRILYLKELRVLLLHPCPVFKGYIYVLCQLHLSTGLQLTKVSERKLGFKPRWSAVN